MDHWRFTVVSLDYSTTRIPINSLKVDHLKAVIPNKLKEQKS